MSSGFDAAVVTTGAKEAYKAVKRLLGHELSADGWRLAGRFDDEPRSDGWYIAHIDPSDPLRLEHVPTGRKLVVPFAKMLTDYASVPRLLQAVGKSSDVLHLDPTRYKAAALFHDELYAAAKAIAVSNVTLKNGRTEARAVVVTISRRQADAVLYVCMECMGATLADALAYHGAVSLFGGRAWKLCRQGDEQWPLMIDLIRKKDAKDGQKEEKPAEETGKEKEEGA